MKDQELGLLSAKELSKRSVGKYGWNQRLAKEALSFSLCRKQNPENIPATKVQIPLFFALRAIANGFKALNNELMSQLTVIIDPNEGNRGSLGTQLSSLGISPVQRYQNISEALKAMGTAKCLAFISASDSYDLAHFVAASRQANKENSVIAVTSIVTAESMRDWIQLGIDQVLVRPFSAKQLEEKIKGAQQFRMQVIKEEATKPKTTDFEVSVKELTSKFYRASITGWISEKANLPKITPTEKEATLFIDTNHLRGINSIGIRLWILWFKILETEGFTRFEFENLTPPLMRHASLIKSFLPTDSSVNSFYLNYWSSDIQAEIEFRFVRGKDFSTDQMRIPRYRHEKVNGDEVTYVLDESSETQLSFYKGKIIIEE